MARRNFMVLDKPDGALLRPLRGGRDLPFNTRWRDVVVGKTPMGPHNTGIYSGSVLTPVPASISNGMAGIYSNLALNDGRFLNTATGDVTIYNSLIDFGAVTTSIAGAVTNMAATGGLLNLIDCKVTGHGSTTFRNAIHGWRVHTLRCDISNGVDGMQLRCRDGNEDGDLDVRSHADWFHDFMYISPDPQQDDNRTHNDAGMQILGGRNVEMIGSRIDATEGPMSFVGEGGVPSGGEIGQGVTLTPTNGKIDDVLIQWNQFNYGFRGFIAEGLAERFGDNIRVWDNKFGPQILNNPSKFYGPIVSRRSFGIDFRRNVDFDGNPVPIYYRDAA